MTCVTSVVGVYFGCFSCMEFVYGISNWTLGLGECYTYGLDFPNYDMKMIRQAMYNINGGRRRPKLGYIFRHENDNIPDFDDIYNFNNTCANVLGLVAVETFLCFGKFYELKTYMLTSSHFNHCNFLHMEFWVHSMLF